MADHGFKMQSISQIANESRRSLIRRPASARYVKADCIHIRDDVARRPTKTTVRKQEPEFVSWVV